MTNCSNCGAALVGQFCARCGADNETAVAPPLAAMAGATAARLAEKRHGVPALLSFFVPGLGQLIKGTVLRGVAVFFGGIVLASLCIAGVGFVLIPIFWVWNVYDAYTAPDGPTRDELKRISGLAVILAATLATIGCGSVTGAPGPDGDAGLSSGTGGTAGARGTGGSQSMGGAGGTGSGGAGGAPCGLNPVCSDGTCGTDNGDPKHCGVSCQVCPSGQACINSACVYPSCDTVLPAPVMFNQGCSPAGSIVSKDGYDCFSACQYSTSVLPTNTECTFKNPITGTGASGLALCVLSCSECS